MTTLYIILAFIALLGAVIWLARRSGAASEKTKGLEKSAEIKDKQIKAALDKPTKSELIDKLRDGKF